MINIQEILRQIPIGTKLYSPILGECTIIGIDPIRVKASNDNCYEFTPYGIYNLPGVKDVECVLFPSKDNHDWNKFEQRLLSRYSTETLRAELKRRNAKEKEIREKEFNNAHRCRNCIHFVKNPNSFLVDAYLCEVRTWGKKIVRHNVVTGSQGLTCDKFKHK